MLLYEVVSVLLRPSVFFSGMFVFRSISHWNPHYNSKKVAAWLKWYDPQHIKFQKMETLNFSTNAVKSTNTTKSPNSVKRHLNLKSFGFMKHFSIQLIINFLFLLHGHFRPFMSENTNSQTNVPSSFFQRNLLVWFFFPGP